jgi:hypothetical protein
VSRTGMTLRHRTQVAGQRKHGTDRAGDDEPAPQRAQRGRGVGRVHCGQSGDGLLKHAGDDAVPLLAPPICPSVGGRSPPPRWATSPSRSRSRRRRWRRTRGRAWSITYHRAQIRDASGFREFTRGDEDKLAGWLAEEVCSVKLRDQQLHQAVLVHTAGSARRNRRRSLGGPASVWCPCCGSTGVGRTPLRGPPARCR